MEPKETTQAELFLLCKQNLKFIYSSWNNTKANDRERGVVLQVQLESIFDDWGATSLTDVIKLLPDEDETASAAQQFLDFDVRRQATTTALIIFSRLERFKFPVIIMDFATLFDAPVCMITDTAFISERLLMVNERPDVFHSLWSVGVITLTDLFYEKESSYVRIFSLLESKAEIEKLVDKCGFFNGDILKKFDSTEQKGFALKSFDCTRFLGFCMYSIEKIEVDNKSLRLHIEYILVDPETKGIGTQLTVRMIEDTLLLYPDYTINAFAEAKTTDQALGFWLTKMGFIIDKERWIEGAYYPCYKLYSTKSVKN